MSAAGLRVRRRFRRDQPRRRPISTKVTTTEIRIEPKQPSRLEKKRNIAGPYPSGDRGYRGAMHVTALRDHVSRQRLLVRVRWIAVAFGLVQVLSYNFATYPPGIYPAALTTVALFAAGNVALALALRGVRTDTAAVRIALASLVLYGLVRGHGDRSVGLGLWIVRRLVSAHGGEVGYARADPGACFTVTPPLRPPGATPGRGRPLRAPP